VTWKESHSIDRDAVSFFPLPRTDFEVRIDFSARIVRKSSQDFHLMSLSGKRFGKCEALKRRFGVEELT
jgi:UDP-3-O-acyl-N-acetylglucosamine deacetylase